MPRSSAASSHGPRHERRHNPLSDDLRATGPLRTKPSKKRNRNEEGEGEQYVNAEASRKILKIGRDLAEEDYIGQQANQASLAFGLDSRFGESEEEDADDNSKGEDAWDNEEEVELEVEDLNPEDLEVFNKFMPGQDQTSQPPDMLENGKREESTNLADLILEKIAAHEATQSGEPDVVGGGMREDAVELPAKFVEVYSKVGLLLSHYKSGKLPKPFKILPTVPYWEDLLAITRPESWTANACYEATKIFTSSKPYQFQRFLEIVLLDRVRDDIHETKKLNVHLYKALKKSLYKPAAFFKGILFKLVGSGTCTLREAQIISSILARVSVPMLHSAAALSRLCDIAAEQSSVSTEGTGAVNIFIRVLLEKKYALPYQAIDALVFHFLRFRPVDPVPGQPDTEFLQQMRDVKLPVLWHQSLLAFAQRYRNDITEDQREALLDLLLVRGHSAIGPEVRRELLEGRGRGSVIEEAGADGADDTMMT